MLKKIAIGIGIWFVIYLFVAVLLNLLGLNEDKSAGIGMLIAIPSSIWFTKRIFDKQKTNIPTKKEDEPLSGLQNNPTKQVENFNIPTPIECDINLPRGELCYFYSRETELKKYKRDNKLNTEDKGGLLITNRRILFVGTKKTISIKLEKIINFNINNNILELKRDMGTAVIFEIRKDFDKNLLFNTLTTLLKSN